MSIHLKLLATESRASSAPVEPTAPAGEFDRALAEARDADARDRKASRAGDDDDPRAHGPGGVPGRDPAGHEPKRMRREEHRAEALQVAVERLTGEGRARDAATHARVASALLDAASTIARGTQTPPKRPLAAPMAPTSTLPEATRSESARSESARSESARSEAARSESARPDPTRSEPARPESARPESARPESARPDSARREAASREVTRSVRTRPGTGQKVDGDASKRDGVAQLRASAVEAMRRAVGTALPNVVRGAASAASQLGRYAIRAEAAVQAAAQAAVDEAGQSADDGLAIDALTAVAGIETSAAGRVETPNAVQQVASARDTAAVVEKLVDQIDTRMLKTGRTQQKMTVQLGGDLGAVRLSLSLARGEGAGQLRVVMEAGSTVAAAALESGVPMLAERLEAKGYTEPVVEVREGKDAEDAGERSDRDAHEQREAAQDDEALAAAIGRRYRDGRARAGRTRGIA